MLSAHSSVPAAMLKEKAQKIRRLYEEGITGLVRAGQELLALKQEMVGSADKAEGYREFRQWYETTLQWPKQQVNRLIDIATAFGEHLELVTRFDVSALYLLSRAKEETRQKALERVAAGEFVSHKVAQELMGRKGGKSGRRARLYKIDLPKGAVLISAPHRRLTDVKAALTAALELIDAKLAKQQL
jgi:hypothetical protein